ncbi:MAG: fused MFS/spermidine synthase [Chloroflexi bacterium]|nr:fused MFS/spermidine synthase [Chloroflexota bacterium]
MLKGSRVWKANAIVFIGGACTMIIELVAGRILAPYVGVSLFTWTSIIGVVLAGISLGNYLGGKVADRWPSKLVLGAIFFAGGLTTIGILPTTAVLGSNPLPITMHIMDRIVLYTFFIFFVPACILGMVTPMVIKLTLMDLKETGGTVGTIYAYSCTGSIVGTFLTGFFLITWFGTRTIVWLVAATLIAMGIMASASWRSSHKWALVVIAVGLFSLGFSGRDEWQAPCLKESNYFCIKVDNTRLEDRDVKALSLDHLVHSYVQVDDPLYLGYGYEKIFADVTHYVAEEKNELRSLFIGGGGYTFPKYLEILYPDSLLEVVEIDPAVTQVVYDELGLPPTTKVKTHNMDARIFLIDRPPSYKYNVIVGDAFNDLSIPYHLTTLEFDKLVKNVLEPDGIFLANIIDDYQTGQFLRSYMYTLKQIYKYIYLFGIGKAWDGTSPSTYVVAAADRPIDMQEMNKVVSANNRGRGIYGEYLEDGALQKYIADGPTLLTDDYAPVDNMVAMLFARPR